MFVFRYNFKAVGGNWWNELHYLIRQLMISDKVVFNLNPWHMSVKRITHDINKSFNKEIASTHSIRWYINNFRRN